MDKRYEDLLVEAVGKRTKTIIVFKSNDKLMSDFMSDGGLFAIVKEAHKKNNRILFYTNTGKITTPIFESIYSPYCDVKSEVLDGIEEGIYYHTGELDFESKEGRKIVDEFGLK